MNKPLKNRNQIKNSSNRRSLRRINKLLEKNLSEYRIPNPYKTSRLGSCLPQNLMKQISKLDYLSVKCLQNVHLKQPLLHEQMSELLIKMRLAVQKQSDQLNVFVNVMQDKIKGMSTKTLIQPQKKSQQYQENLLNNSAYLPKDSNNSISLQAQHQQDPLNEISRESERAIIMSDNYETDKLLFNVHRSFLIGHQAYSEGLEHQQHMQSYDL